MNVKIYKRIASLAVNVGVNLQKGQDAVIYISTRQSELAKYLTLECYKKGARKVTVEWKNDDISKLNYRHQGIKPLTKLEPWEIEKEKFRAEKKPCLIHVIDSDPDVFGSLDLEKVNRSINARRKAIKPYRDAVENLNQWVIIAVPSKEWAVKVFPNDPIPTALRKLWKAVIKCMRVDNSNPKHAWVEHINYLKQQAKKLNDLNLDYLHYTSKNGTDLVLHLNPKHQWLAASEVNLKGIEYVANMPTEEVYTMPLKDGVDGIVYSTKPLSYQGTIIDEFSVRFEKGRVIEVKAKKGQEALEKLVASDEGSHYLGEVALVPFDSPVNQCGCLFYETLFDENASCHLAFGQAYKNTFRNFESMTEEDFKYFKYNDSLIHVDFMVGTDDLKIEGFDKKGQKYVIFENGVWSI